MILKFNSPHKAIHAHALCQFPGHHQHRDTEETAVVIVNEHVLRESDGEEMLEVPDEVSHHFQFYRTQEIYIPVWKFIF